MGTLSSADASPRISQKDLARILGLSQSTVSLGLRNHSSIGTATCERIQKAAQRFGYVPDPYLSGLSAYRKRVKPATCQGALAWLSNDEDGQAWKQWPALIAYHDSAVERARQLGYRLEDYCLRSPGMTSARLEKIFHTRNIPGILVAPLRGSTAMLDFHFDLFSAITFGYSMEKPRLHFVSYHQLRAMETTFRKLHDLGYRRPGLAIYPEGDRRAGRSWSAGFRNEQHHYGDIAHIPPLLSDSPAPELFIDWFRQWKPDVVLTVEARRLDWLEQAGVSVPHDTGFCLLSVPPPGKEHCAGCQEDPREVGAKAVEFLVDMIHRHEVGLPAKQVCILTEGIWRDGSTLRRQKAPVSISG